MEGDLYTFYLQNVFESYCKSEILTVTIKYKHFLWTIKLFNIKQHQNEVPAQSIVSEILNNMCVLDLTTVPRGANLALKEWIAS